MIDNNGCVAASLGSPVTVNVWSLPSVSINALANVTICSYNANGVEAAVPTGGTSGYTYAWSPSISGTTQTVSTFLAGQVYTVTVTDANTCTASATHAALTAPAPVTVNPTVTTIITCNNACIAPLPIVSGTTALTGKISATPSGGTSPYHNWVMTGTASSSQASSSLFSGLYTGSYTFTVQDANNCTSPTPVTIPLNQPTLPNAVEALPDNSKTTITVSGSGGLSSTGGTT